jgi:putative membrane protein
LPGVLLTGFVSALIVSLVLGLVNAFIKPFLVLITLPINILTLGLFTLVINALLIMLVSYLVPGFKVDGFWWALIFSVTLSITSWLLSLLFA